MAVLVQQNIEELNFLDRMYENTSLAKGTDDTRSIVLGTPLDQSISGPFLLEKLTREVVIDGVTKMEDYYARVWKVEQFTSEDTPNTVYDFMNLLLSNQIEEVAPSTFSMPEGYVRLGES